MQQTVKTGAHRVTRDIRIRFNDARQTAQLPAGAIVKRINACYVSKASEYPLYPGECFVFSQFGLGVVEEAALRAID